jgi:hypothetical protein
VIVVESKEFWEDKKWARENYSKLQKQFGNKWVAVVRGKVVSHGENRGEVRKRAIELTGSKHVSLVFVESGAAIY